MHRSAALLPSRLCRGVLCRAASSFSSIVHSDLSYRALLRNLRLLRGLRGDKPQFRVVITGSDAEHVAAAMLRMEPAMQFEVVPGGDTAALGACWWRRRWWEGGVGADTAVYGGGC